VSIHDKFAALMNGTLSEAEHAELEKLLINDAEARRQWYLHADIDLGLAEWASTLAVADSHALPKLAPARRARWPWLAAAAAIVLLGSGWWLVSQREEAGAGVALLRQSAEAVWDGAAPSSGSMLSRGELHLTSGAALIEFFSGARLLIEAPCRLDLVSSNSAFLHSGKVNAHVPPQARGFTIESATLKLIDHGTDFGFVTQERAAAEVHVFNGEVEIQPVDQTARHLTTGEAAQIENTSVRSIASNRAAFLDEATLDQKASSRFDAWRQATVGLKADPALLMHQTFDADELKKLVVVGSERTRGRWAAKDALAFRGEGDRVRFTIEKPLKTITLLAWVRVDALERSQNVLLSTDSEQPGSLHWHITKRGELRLEIARDLGRRYSDWEAVNSHPVIKTGHWTFLATTFDGQTIRHYADGQPIGSGASFTPPAMHIGTAELGNWRGEMKRHLAATMDEFAILSRVMSEDEVHAAYAAGKP